jgi:hypothetical protein
MDMTQRSEEATIERFNAQQDRIARDFGYGDTVGALEITKGALDPLTSYIKDKLQNPSRWAQDPAQELGLIIRNLPVETVALCTLNAVLGSIAIGDKLVKTVQAVGAAIEHECWAADLLMDDNGLAQRVATAVRKKHGRLDYRRQAARSIAARCGFKAKSWDRRKQTLAGAVLVRYLIDALPDVFVRVSEEKWVDLKPHTEDFLAITEGANEKAQQAVEVASAHGAPEPLDGRALV